MLRVESTGTKYFFIGQYKGAKQRNKPIIMIFDQSRVYKIVYCRSRVCLSHAPTACGSILQTRVKSNFQHVVYTIFFRRPQKKNANIRHPFKLSANQISQIFHCTRLGCSFVFVLKSFAILNFH
jgi:hypothetical protein